MGVTIHWGSSPSLRAATPVVWGPEPWETCHLCHDLGQDHPRLQGETSQHRAHKMEILYDIMTDEGTFLGHLPSRFSNLESAAFFLLLQGSRAKHLNPLLLLANRSIFVAWSLVNSPTYGVLWGTIFMTRCSLFWGPPEHGFYII